MANLDKKMKKTITSSSSYTVAQDGEMSSDLQNDKAAAHSRYTAIMGETHPIAMALKKSRTARFQDKFERHLSQH